VTLQCIRFKQHYREIGQATTDASGTYQITWTPDISAHTQSMASFAGTNGYWPSSAETAFTVMEPSTATQPLHLKLR